MAMPTDTSGSETQGYMYANRQTRFVFGRCTSHDVVKRRRSSCYYIGNRGVVNSKLFSVLRQVYRFDIRMPVAPAAKHRGRRKAPVEVRGQGDAIPPFGRLSHHHPASRRGYEYRTTK